MTIQTKDYSDPRYDIVREHHARPLPSHFEAFDARGAKREAESQKTAKDDPTVSS